MQVGEELRTREADRHSRVEFAAFALLAYIPFLLSSPGRLSPDTKEYLYLDPDRLLSRAPYLWDPHVGFGTVTHQLIGYLFPMGPFYWFMQHVGVPDWVAQRLWLGSISLAAALGARWLFRMLGISRAGAIGGALVYMLTPYQLAFTARLSVLLLAWAGLPWLVGLTMRSVRRGGWRDPALFALVILVIGTVNASSLVFVVIGPGLWLLLDACRGRGAFFDALRAGIRIVVLTVATSLWWIVGLRTQGAYGLPVLKLTETLRTVASSSDPTDILRGLGNWFFYGRDGLGNTLDQASSYIHSPLVQVASYGVPAVALASAGIIRWRHRVYFALLVVVGTVVSVGAWRYDDPSPYGAFFKWFSGNAAGLALRNTPRALPLLVLGLAGLIAAAVTAVAPRLGNLWPAVVVGVLACAALTPVWTGGYLSHNLDQPNDVPAYWRQAINALDREGDATRVLEIPGSDFAAYRWGDTIEPITPGLMNRPYVARETLPSGTPPSVNLLVALDHRLQDGTLEPDALAAYARLAGIGTIDLRSDLQYERFGTPRPRLMWQQLTNPLPKGLDQPRPFGPTTRNQAVPEVPNLDSLDLRIPPSAPDPPAVSVFDVKGAIPIVHSAPSTQPVVLAGDGEGIVDAAAAGLLDGRSLVLESGSLDTAALHNAIRNGADLVLTDSNRRRNQQFFAGVRDNSGFTEAAGKNSSKSEFRLDPFPQSGDATRTVMQQHGGTVTASDYVTPTDRPAKAFDGDPRSSWLATGKHVVGQHITVDSNKQQTVDHITLAQRPVDPTDQSISAVKLTFDGGAPIHVPLDPSSFSAAGQTISFPTRTAKRLDVQIEAVNRPTPHSSNGVGFTEIGFGDTRITETVRLPTDLPQRIGGTVAGHRVDVVLSRLRDEPSQRLDEELNLDRQFALPDSRAYLVSGTARIEPNASDTVLDAALGTTAPGVQYTSSSHLGGDIDARASRAFDGNAQTAWTPGLGLWAIGSWLQVSMPAPRTVDQLRLGVVADNRHSLPTQITIVADGQPARTIPLPDLTPSDREGTVKTLDLHFDPVTAKDLRIQFDTTTMTYTEVGPQVNPVLLPISIAEASFPGIPRPASPGTIDSGCRSDLVTVDGKPFPVDIRGPVANDRSGLQLSACAPALALDQGSHHVVTAKAFDSGFAVDRLVLSSDQAGRPAPIAPLGKPVSASGARVRVTSTTPDSYHLRVQTNGAPFWVVLGQSHSDGWEATFAGRSLGRPQLVNGFANGWVVRPGKAGTYDIVLRWTPQRIVWVGLAVSLVAVAVCVLLVFVRRRRVVTTSAGPALFDEPRYALPLSFVTRPTNMGVTLAAAVSAGIVTTLFSRWWIGLIVGVVTFVGAQLTRGRLLLAAGAPVTLALGALFDIPELGWLAVGLLLADLIAGAWWSRTTKRE